MKEMLRFAQHDVDFFTTFQDDARIIFYIKKTFVLFEPLWLKSLLKRGYL
jgi:hypothetical protein